MNFVIISCSLDPESRSFVLAQMAHTELTVQGNNAQLIDLRTSPLPAFDNSTVYGDANLISLNQAIAAADGIVIASPVYNWSLGSAAKNLIEATGSTDSSRGVRSPWFDKLVTFFMSGGIPHSYTAHAPLMTSMMVDFRCIINPYHVYATGRDWEGTELNQRASEKLTKALQVKMELAERLRGRSYQSSWSV